MRKTFVLVGLAIGLVACGGGHDATAPVDPSAAIAGSYTLTKVNGSTLPAIYFQNSAGTITTTGGSLTLRPDHSYIQSVSLTATYTGGSPQPQTVNENGTFAVTGSQITFTVPASAGGSALSYTGAVSGGIVSYTYSNDSYEYRKR